MADIEALLHALHLSDVLLVGHDWGGPVAYATAAACHDLVSQLVVLNAPHPSLVRREYVHDNAQRTAALGYVPLIAGDVLWNAATLAGQMLLHITDLSLQARILEQFGEEGVAKGASDWYRANPFADPVNFEVREAIRYQIGPHLDHGGFI